MLGNTRDNPIVMLTLALATHNGSMTLGQTLDSLTKLRFPSNDWKLIVIDNASTDETSNILQSFTERLPLQILHQPKPGKNAALNLAIPHFEGELIIFTDDDIEPTSNWLIVMNQVAIDNPDYDLFGGVIRPKWPCKPPDWLLEDVPIRIVYGITAEKWTDGPTRPGCIRGANMAIRHNIFRSGYRFDEDVGPQPGQYRMGSESEFTARLAKLGFKLWHCKSSRVQHIIRSHQMDPHWIIRRAYRFGRDMYWKENDPELVEHETWSEDAKLVFELPRWYYSALLRESVNAIRAKLQGDFRKWVRASWEISYWRGYFYEAFHDGAHLRRSRS